jgi:hypothetical protein
MTQTLFSDIKKAAVKYYNNHGPRVDFDDIWPQLSFMAQYLHTHTLPRAANKIVINKLGFIRARLLQYTKVSIMCLQAKFAVIYRSFAVMGYKALHGVTWLYRIIWFV